MANCYITNMLEFKMYLISTTHYFESRFWYGAQELILQLFNIVKMTLNTLLGQLIHYNYIYLNILT